jgi:hypothetical protein
MVRRGSTVRVRQRASVFSLLSGRFLLAERGGDLLGPPQLALACVEVGSFDQVPARSACSRFPADNVALSERWARTRFTELRNYGTLPR